MKRLLTYMLCVLAITLSANAQSYSFGFTGAGPKDAIKVTPSMTYDKSVGYGYDLNTSWDGKSNAPFFFSVDVPDGNYRVTVTLGSKNDDGSTTVRGESRRLFYENIVTRKGETFTGTFTINKRNPQIEGGGKVANKDREAGKMNWDDKLTLEFNGDAPRLQSIVIEKVENVPTIFLCGDSTVTDNNAEPYACWGQMIPRFFNENVSFANYAESGLCANTFIGQKRLEKMLTQMKRGDWVIVEFGHNDQKQDKIGNGAHYLFSYSIKQFIDEAARKGAKVVLVTPTRRRQFNSNGTVKDTHDDYPEVIREIAQREKLPLIDLQEMTKTLIEAMGEEESKHLFTHYPVGTWEGQTTELKDNTHFNTFGAYEVAKCVIEGMKTANLPFVKELRDDYASFDPAHPDQFSSFKWNNSPLTAVAKPKGS